MYYNNFYYDPAGNRTRLEYNDGTGTTTTSYLYNSADQLTRESVGETNTTYLYDANGNLTKKDDGTNVHSYAYDFRNLMTTYDGPGSSNDATYKYDAEDRRITKDVNGTKTAYFHDGLDVVAEYNGNDQLQRTYVTPGLDDNLTMTASGSTYYYLKDALGSVRQLLNSSEATQNSYDYFTFGSIYGTPTENVTQPFRYTARAWDVESTLYYYRARNYDAALGRFLGRDPLRHTGRTTTLYAYVLNNPLYYIDPLGLREGREFIIQFELFNFPWTEDDMIRIRDIVQGIADEAFKDCKYDRVRVIFQITTLRLKDGDLGLQRPAKEHWWQRRRPPYCWVQEIEFVEGPTLAGCVAQSGGSRTNVSRQMFMDKLEWAYGNQLKPEPVPPPAKCIGMANVLAHEVFFGAMLNEFDVLPPFVATGTPDIAKWQADSSKPVSIPPKYVKALKKLLDLR